MTPESPSANAIGAASLLNQRYELAERLADSAFFYVFSARDLVENRPVLVKVLKPEFAADEAFAQRLLAEAQRAVGLKHPNIAQVYAAWRERGTVLIACEWVRGIHLKDRIRRVAPFPLAVAIDIAHACAEALAYAHANGFPCGDLCPEKIVVTPEGRVKLTDLGIGTSLTASTRIQWTALPRSVYYLAPELAGGGSPDERTDLYSLGCILYEMVTGEPPYDAETPLAVAVKHVQEPVPSAHAALRSVPVAVDGLIRHCLQKNPADRYPSLAALLEDLRRVQEAIRTDRPLDRWPLDGNAEAPAVPTSAPSRREAREKPVREKRVPEDTGPSTGLLLGIGLVGLVMVIGFFAAIALFTRAPSQVTVPPDLKGMPRERAVAELARLGLKAEIREEYHDRIPAGQVYDSAPPGGTDLRSGKTVLLYVSRGPQPVLVPDVVGRELAAAQKELQAAGLVVGEIREEHSEVVPKGQVMSQAPTGGTEARKRSPVSLIVSKGPQPAPPEPEPVAIVPQPPEGPSEPAEGTEPPASDFEVAIRVPRSASGPQRVRILVRQENETEDTPVYDQDHLPGEEVRHTVTVFGRDGTCRIRVYVGDRLAYDRTGPPFPER